LKQHPAQACYFSPAGEVCKFSHVFSNHSNPSKILLTKLFSLLILPLKEFFFNAWGEKEINPGGPFEKAHENL
jgi:hypothetical protein